MGIAGSYQWTKDRQRDLRSDDVLVGRQGLLKNVALVEFVFHETFKPLVEVIRH